MDPLIYADNIFYYEGAIKDPSRLVDLIESSDDSISDSDAIFKWTNWTTSGGESAYVYGRQKHTDASKLNTSSQDIKTIFHTIFDALVRHGRDYCLSLGIDPIDPSPLVISKYNQGTEMGPHIDWYGDNMSDPVMSSVLYLNDNYEGGELYFPKFDIKIKPKAGSIIIFPSVDPYFHESLLIESGVKYMSPSFWIRHRS